MEHLSSWDKRWLIEAVICLLRLHSGDAFALSSSSLFIECLPDRIPAISTSTMMFLNKKRQKQRTTESGFKQWDWCLRLRLPVPPDIITLPWMVWFSNQVFGLNTHQAAVGWKHKESRQRKTETCWSIPSWHILSWRWWLPFWLYWETSWFAGLCVSIPTCRMWLTCLWCLWLWQISLWVFWQFHLPSSSGKISCL